MSKTVKSTAPAKWQADAGLKGRAFWERHGRLSIAASLDPTVSEAALVTLGLRSCFVNFSLKVNSAIFAKAVKSGKGERTTLFGRDVRETALADLKRLGWIERQQFRKRGGQGKPWKTDTIETISPGALRGGYRVIWLEMFNERFTLPALATMLYARAAYQVTAEEVAKRFDWGLPKARTAINELVEAGCLVKFRLSGTDGRRIANRDTSQSIFGGKRRASDAPQVSADSPLSQGNHGQKYPSKSRAYTYGTGMLANQLLIAAYDAHDSHIADSDLDDEQPLSLSVRMTLGDIRSIARSEREGASHDRAIETMLTGGNHLANWLIGHVGGDFATRLPYSGSDHVAMEALGPDYDVWACWAALMRARDSLGKE